MMKYLITLFAVVALAALAYAQQVTAPLGPNGIACAYNASPPTLTTDNAVWVQCDSTGHLLISGGGGLPISVKPAVLTPLGYCQLSVTTAVQTSTCSGFPSTATYAAVCDEGAGAARWRDDGTAPTTTVGQPLGAGTATAPSCQGMSTTFSTLQWIAQSGTAVLDFTFYK